MVDASCRVRCREVGDAGLRGFGAERIKLSRARPAAPRKIWMECEGIETLLEEIGAREASLPRDCHIEEGLRKNVSVSDDINFAGHVIDEETMGPVARVEQEIDPGPRRRVAARRNLDHVFQYDGEFHRSRPPAAVAASLQHRRRTGQQDRCRDAEQVQVQTRWRQGNVVFVLQSRLSAGL